MELIGREIFSDRLLPVFRPEHSLRSFDVKSKLSLHFAGAAKRDRLLWGISLGSVQLERMKENSEDEYCQEISEPAVPQRDPPFARFVGRAGPSVWAS